MKTLLVNIVKEQDVWCMEEIGDKKVKHPLSLPGAKVSPKQVGALKLYRTQFYSCTSCRWSLTGEGCCYCNPKKHEELLKKKTRLANELSLALQKGLEKLREQGMIPEHVGQTHGVVDATQPLEGGGDSLSLSLWRSLTLQKLLFGEH